MAKKVTAGFYPMVRTRHPSHSQLRTDLPKLPFRSVIRMGSTTALPDDVSRGGQRVELNTVEAIKTSSNKLLMKQAFDRAEASTAPWAKHDEVTSATQEGLQILNRESISFPIVAKAKFGSKGSGNTLIKSLEEYNTWRADKTMSNYIFEKFVNYGLEYRLHISAEGCFYTCRKALKKDCPPDQKWRHHDDTCVWFMEESEDFKKPNSWNNIIDDCVAALLEIGADILAFDVKVQSPTNNKGKVRDFQEYILLESNSAPSFGEVTLQKYLSVIPQVLITKKG